MNHIMNTSNHEDYSNDPWYRALLVCTTCLREQDAGEADVCLAYLGLLEQRLNVEGITVSDDDGDGEDDNDKDDLSPDVDSDSDSGSDNVIGAIDIYDDHRMPMKYPPSWFDFCSVFLRTSDLERTVQEGLTGPTDSIGHASGSPRLPGKRLFTRIFTSQSEVFALKATHTVRTDQNWAAAAVAYKSAIHKIHRALDVTDMEISRWWSHHETMEDQRYDNNRKHRQRQLWHQQLVEDANIVEVALLSMTESRDRLITTGKRQEAKLQRKLQPQWESRDEVKKRMGTDRWNNNPNPKRDYARLRADLEEELKILQLAMKSLEELDPQVALQKARGLQDQLLTNNHQQRSSRSNQNKKKNNGKRNNQNEKENNRNGGPSTTKSRNQQQTKDDQQDRQLQKHRYNNTRPSPQFMRQRVSLLDYPDPVDLGWIFTGSWEAVEFFERRVSEKLIKLDWYFTTATMKTSLDHPTQGKTQLFAKKCDPHLYAKVLANPRTHTGNRYHKKPRPRKN